MLETSVGIARPSSSKTLSAPCFVLPLLVRPASAVSRRRLVPGLEELRPTALHLPLLEFRPCVPEFSASAPHAPRLPRARVNVSLRVHLVAARQTSQLYLKIASSSAPTTSPLPLSCALPPTAATTLLPLFHLLIFPCFWVHSLALHCDCCLTYNNRVSGFAHQHASCISISFQLPSACRTPRRMFSSRKTLARPASCENDAAGTLPLLPLLPSVFGPFVEDTNCHLPSNSSD